MRAMLLLGGLIASPSPAMATCVPAIIDVDRSLSIVATSVDGGGVATGTIRVRVGKAEDGSASRCSATLRISRIGAALSRDNPNYLVRAPGNNNVEILTEGAAGGSPRADILIADVPADAAGRVIPIRFDVPTSWGMAAGTFAEQLLLTLQDPQGTIISQSDVNVTISIPTVVAVRFAGAVVGDGRANRIDLGNLSRTTETRSAPIAVRILSTAPYSVSLTSINSGALLLDGGSETIPYRLFFDGRRVLADGANIPLGAAHTGSTGDVRSLSIVVPPVLATAGTYSDRLTVQVSAQ